MNGLQSTEIKERDDGKSNAERTGKLWAGRPGL